MDRLLDDNRYSTLFKVLILKLLMFLYVPVICVFYFEFYTDMCMCLLQSFICYVAAFTRNKVYTIALRRIFTAAFARCSLHVYYGPKQSERQSGDQLR